MKAETSRLSKETLFFLAASAAFAAALYNYLASQPLPLCSGAPISTGAAPDPVCAAALPSLPDVNVAVRGDRESPFGPARPPKINEPTVPKPDSHIVSSPLRPVHPGPEDVKPAEEAPNTPLPPAKSASDLRYVGIAIVNMRARALLSSPDKFFCVKKGDVIPEYGCTVTRIARQSIHLLDSRQQPVILSDGR